MGTLAVHFSKKALYGILAVFCIIQAVLIWKYESESGKNIRVPDEEKTAAALLAKKLSGARYFYLESGSGNPAFPFLTLTEAREQSSRVARERGFDPEKTGRLKELINGLVEPSSSRGAQEVINSLRLNLAVDEMDRIP